MLSIKDFWDMVERWKSTCVIDSDSYLDQAMEDLQKLDFQEQLRFKEIMNAYIDHADVPGLWDAATVMKNGCSDEDFLYFRAWLIAQGKETYLEALRDPDSLVRFLVPEKMETPVPFDFEEFLYYPSWPYMDEHEGESSEAFYSALRDLPEQELWELRKEIQYAEGIAVLRTSNQELREFLPDLCEKTGFTGSPDWGEQARVQKWGCDWQAESGPDSGPSMRI